MVKNKQSNLIASVKMLNIGVITNILQAKEYRGVGMGLFSIC